MDMAHREIQEERANNQAGGTSETEKQFLKDLYNYMKKRDTPIERIPNLGFKQIDLFVMFKTVRDLGGYHQVTGQQLWKQVYNTLGGNPRSTSAATCTRRHYEKLLLPYECHVKGLSLNILPYHQSKHFLSATYCKEDDDSQIPAKRKMLSLAMHQQNLHTLQLDRHGSAFHLPLHYPNYYHQMNAPLTPLVPMPSSMLTPQSSTAPQPKISFDPYGPYPAESVNEPLEHLRYLAERYKTSSGLIEPLNLSIKESRQGTKSNPASSFSPPSSSKNPKFLNKPSPLYSPHCPQVVRSERCEVQDGEMGSKATTYSYPANAQEVYVVDGNAMTASSSPTYESAVTPKTDKGTPTTSQKPSSPQMDLTPQAKEKREGSAEIRGLSLSQTLPGIPRKNERGEMEIEVPLSVFHKWLKLCRSSATMQEHRQPPTLPAQDHPGQRDSLEPDVLPTNLSFHMNPQHRHLVGEDLRLRQSNLPSPVPPTQTTSNHHNMSQNPYTCYKPLSSSGTLQNVTSQNDYVYDQQDITRSCSSKQPNGSDAYDHETPSQAKTDSHQVTVQPNFEPYNSNKGDTVQKGVEKSETAPSAVFMLNSSSTSLLHLTTEEVMKLKKIISNSL